MTSPKKIPLQVQKQREQRHVKLMKMINGYELTREEKSKLQKIKSHTMMEINLRFLRSQINRNYKFPKVNKSIQTVDSSQQLILQREQNQGDEDRKLKQQFQQYTQKKTARKKPGQYLMYDLRSQNQSNKPKQMKQNDIKTYTTKILSIQQSRRVHSMGNDKSLEKQKQGFIIKRHNPIRNSSQRFSKSPPNIGQSKSTRSLKVTKPISLTRRQSKQKQFQDGSLQRNSPLGINTKRLMVDNRKLKLPQINSLSSNQLKSFRKLNPVHEKLKTQKHYDQEEIQFAIGKKLVTQIDSGKKPIKGVQKYLKQLQTQKKQKYHLNLNIQPPNFMKKDKSPQKINTNFLIFKSAKNSLKRQIE